MTRILLISLLLGALVQSICAGGKVRSKEEEFSSKELEAVGLTPEDIQKYLPLVLDSLYAESSPVTNTLTTHHRAKRTLLLKKKLIIGKILLLKKLGLFSLLGNKGGQQKGYGWGPKPQPQTEGYGWGPSPTPQPSYGPPPQPSYGPPPMESYGPPPQQGYGR